MSWQAHLATGIYRWRFPYTSCEISVTKGASFVSSSSSWTNKTNASSFYHHTTPHLTPLYRSPPPELKRVSEAVWGPVVIIFPKMPPQTHENTSENVVDTDIDDIDDIDMQRFSSHGGCCFWIPCFGSKPGPSPSSVWWERIRAVDYNYKANDAPWWTRGWKRLREWSEITAGPKWKTFIRTFRKNHQRFVICVRGGCAGGAQHRQQPKFYYDPLSYSLNFDEGAATDEDLASRDFSSRFASVVFGKDTPPLTTPLNLVT